MSDAFKERLIRLVQPRQPKDVGYLNETSVINELVEYSDKFLKPYLDQINGISLNKRGNVYSHKSGGGGLNKISVLLILDWDREEHGGKSIVMDINSDWVLEIRAGMLTALSRGKKYFLKEDGLGEQSEEIENFLISLVENPQSCSWNNIPPLRRDQSMDSSGSLK